MSNPNHGKPRPEGAPAPRGETLAYGARAGEDRQATAQTVLVPSGSDGAPQMVRPEAATGAVTGAVAGAVARAATKAAALQGDETLLANPGGATLAAAAGQDPRASGPVDTQVPSPARGAQVTVLPRVELQGDRPTFVTDLRQRYEILGPLGEGGIGEVLAARDHDIDRRVALKRIRSQVQSPAALARFVEEIRTTGGLEHPNIVPIHDVGRDEEGRYYFVMKYVDGETLESVIARLRAGEPEAHASYGFERRVEVFKAVLEAIAYAHSRGYVHRDIKPANIMVGAFGEVLVMDWGIARTTDQKAPSIDRVLAAGAEADQGAGSSAETGGQASSSSDAPIARASQDRPFATQVGSLIGTPAYMAPEQARGEPADERSDIYALGVLLHEFLTLRHYLEDRRSVADTLLGVQEKPLPHASFLRHPHQSPVPADLGWFVVRAVTKAPVERYPSVQAMIERLDRRAEGEIPVQCPMTALKASSHWAMRLLDRRPLLALGAVALTALSLVLGAVYVISSVF
ncbi:MAG: serine/threonine-protein kinase [Polyangia bacterium]|nr:serine/threonine-protein kinase [Polyangia bacterium]